MKGFDWKAEPVNDSNTTDFRHFSLIADGVAVDIEDYFECPQGRAVMTIKVWASDHDHAVLLTKNIGQQLGFQPDGSIEIYDTEAESTMEDRPYGYDVHFVPYEDEKGQ